MKQTIQNVVQDTEAVEITGLQTLFATELFATLSQGGKNYLKGANWSP